MPQTPRWSLPYPSSSDPPNVPLDLQKLAVAADSGLNQHFHLYPGTSEDDITLTVPARNVVNYTFTIPEAWQRAIVLFHWSARQWTNAGSHIRTGYRIFLNGAQNGPTLQEGAYAPSGNQPARMMQATRCWGDVGAGTQRVTITGEIQIGNNNQAFLGAQTWFVAMLRTQ